MEPRVIDLMGLYDVARWGVVKVMRPQSVAEHCFGVAVLAIELADLLLVVDDRERASIMYWSIVHDAPETLTCDIDGKFKRDNPDIRAAIIAAENRAFPWYAEVAAAVEPHVNAIVKVADKLETIHYIRTWGIGTRADDVKRELVHILFHEATPKLVEAMTGRFAPLDEIKFMVGGLLNRHLLESNSIQFR